MAIRQCCLVITLLHTHKSRYLVNRKIWLSWFFPSVVKHATRFKRVIIASLFIQAFAIISPKLFQVVIDKVLVSRGLQSLDINF